MPRISEVCGVSIYMYWFDNKKHHEPHIHAKSNGKSAVFSIKGELIAGTLGTTYDKLVTKFINKKRRKLSKNWNLAISGKELLWIK